MITAKLSDVWGLKTVLLACGAIFFIFSMACGAAQTMTQLYGNAPPLFHHRADFSGLSSVHSRVSVALAFTRLPSSQF